MPPYAAIPLAWNLALYGCGVLVLVVALLGVVFVIRAGYIPTRTRVLWMLLVLLVPLLGTAVWFASGYQPPEVRRALGYRR